MSEADAASRGSAIKLAAEAAGRVVNVGTTVLILRSLSLADWGIWGVAGSAAVIAAETADLGLQATAGRDLAAHRLGLVPVVRAKVALTVLTAALLPLLWWLSRLAAGDIGLGLFAPLLAYYTMSGWAELLGVAARMRGRPLHEAAIILCFRLALLAVVAAVVLRGGRLEILAWGHVAATLAPVLLASVLLARLPHADEPEMPVAALLRTAAPLGVNGFLALASVRIEWLALGRWAAGADEVGLFGSAQQLLLFLLVVPNAICAGAMPALTREALKRDGPVRERTALTLALLAVPAAVGLALVPQVVEVFGGQYRGAGPILRVLALSVPALFMNALLQHALIAAGRGARVARLTAVRVALAAILAVVLIPRAGVMGAAAGFVASELALLVLARRSCADAGFAVSVLRPLVRGVLLSMPMAAVLVFVSLVPLVQVAVGVLVYAATIAVAWWFRPR
jgi:O-antigen/teichoic acid export membrane protein